MTCRAGFRVVFGALLLSACDVGGGGTADELDDGSVPVGKDAASTTDPDGGMVDAAMRDARVVREAAAPAPGCGDNTKSGSEECDDGNILDGDGCSAQCTKEAGFNCPTGAGACAPICGDGGLLVQGEACDDGNVMPGDGCNATCQLENGWLCLGSGAGTCMSAGCGDGVIVGSETCDDGNMIPGDGCSITCAIESGWLCPVMATPCVAASCGDGIRVADEKCDDGNTEPNDGCTASCDAVEPNYSCPFQGGACTRTSICGNGLLTSDEQCDDRNTVDGDGCSKTCQLEMGWQCTVIGRACSALKCGDSIVAGNEQCDDGNSTASDGCSATCQIEPGYVCPSSGCRPTVCGDGTTEGSEQCDDGLNDLPYDGCYQCQKEPTCTNNGCTSVCGDGIKFPDEACDDGNTRSGDGCSATCTKEVGFTCTDNTIGTQSLALPIILRDFRGKGLPAITTGGKNIAPGHIDFNDKSRGLETGAVKTTLDGEKKPVLADTLIANTNFSTAANFAQWYRNQPAGVAEFVRTVPHTLTLNKVGAGFQFSSDEFFPLDNKGFVGTGDEPTYNGGPTGRVGPHNFSFTSELRYWFQYQGNEKLDFTGDDDVWVFINGVLAVDLGGVHGAVNGTVTLNAAAATKHNLQIGKIYEAVLFQAERHTSNSNYRLTLTGFDRVRTSCESVCGDGVVTSDEVCDDGKNDSSYGGCAAGCQAFGPSCGDAMPQSSEQCDLGYTGNTGTYGGCTADCKLGPKCGDAKVDGYYGEQCDLGTTSNVGGYGGCAADCKFSDRCGDGRVQMDHEQCDDGLNRSAYGGCGPGCKLAPYCGDGTVQLARGEQCDLGTANNTGAYGGCKADCKKASYCGDNVVDTANGETCDDGNQNDFDGCSRACHPDTVF